VHLDRVVVLARDHVGLVDLNVDLRERSFGIAAPRLRWRAFALVGLLCCRQDRLSTGNVDGRGLGRVGNAYQGCRMVGLFERIADHERDRLALMARAVVLKHVQALAKCRVHHGLMLAIG
jgi:hypothetical protein